MASRSLLSNVGPRGARGHRRFDREREARHHERHLIARGSQSLVHEAEEVAVAGLSGGDEGHARAGHELSHGKTALAAAGPAENQMRQSHGSRILPRRPVMVVRARAGLLALGSSYSPRLPGLTASGFRGFRPRSQ